MTSRGRGRPRRECKHFWLSPSQIGFRWKRDGLGVYHGPIQCKHCYALSWTEYGKFGPCEHVVGGSGIVEMETAEPVQSWSPQCDMCETTIDKGLRCSECEEKYGSAEDQESTASVPNG